MGREHLAVFKLFRTWACYQGCDEALETELIVINDEEVVRPFLEEMHRKHFW